MPPPKAKLHKNTGRLKNINNSYVSSPTSGNRANQVAVNNQNTPNIQPPRNDVPASASTSGDASSAMEQFELELYWCIQTLENSLSSGKLNAKQGNRMKTNR